MKQEDIARLLNLIDTKQDEAVGFLRQLVSIDSTFVEQGVGGNELAIQQWLEGYFSQRGYETRLFEPDNEKIKGYPDYNPGHDYTDRPNLIAIRRGTGAGRSLILNGHVDTVPLGDRELWSHDPLGGEVADGRMYSRGTCDMKAGLAAMILALESLQEAGLELKGDVIIESVVDEEGGGNGTLACVVEGYRADAAIVTEPTGLHIRPASRGVFLLKVDVVGKATHAALKWEGVNAIEKAVKIVQGMYELEHRWLARRNNPLLPSPTITIGQVEGGLAGAIVPNECSMKFDVKYLPVEVGPDGREHRVTGETVRQEVEDWIATICAGDEWLREHPPKLDWYLHVLPHWLDPRHELVGILSRACEETFGQSIITGMPSGADARILQNAGHIDTIIFGPGGLQQAHSIDEYVPLDQFMNAIKALALSIYRWTSEAGDE